MKVPPAPVAVRAAGRDRADHGHDRAMAATKRFTRRRRRGELKTSGRGVSVVIAATGHDARPAPVIAAAGVAEVADAADLKSVLSTKLAEPCRIENSQCWQ
jgi:hypothetical protein